MQRAISRLKENELVLRAVASLLALMTFVGFTWFNTDYSSAWEKFYTFSPTLGLALGAAIPNRLMVMILAKYGLPLLLILGVARTVQDLFEDVQLLDGTDYPAIVIHALVSLVLVLLLVRSLPFRREKNA
jgi:hypothetical protein